jgi:Tol biopolymer transport system component
MKPALLILSLAAFPTIAVAAEPVRLTTDGRLCRDPVVWPDGKSIVYTLEQDSGRMKIVRFDLATKKVELLHKDDKISDRELTVSGDGNVYAYNVVKGGPGIIGDLFVVRIDPPAMVKVPAEQQWSSWPAISADGKSVVYAETGSKFHYFKIDFDDPAYRTDGDGELDEKARKKMEELRKEARKKALGAKALWEIKGDYNWPRLSPDGKSIVCGSQKLGDFELFTMDIDGKNEKRLTKSPGIDARPAWSPDGKRIAFTSNRDGNYEIYVMNADGSNPRRITNHPERDDFPSWHPDGKRLVFVGERKGSFDVYMIDVDEK